MLYASRARRRINTGTFTDSYLNEAVMRHIMLDIETLGVTPGCVVLSIGAVEFSTTESENYGTSFKAHLDTEQQVKAGLRIEPRTMDWWLGQSEEARTALLSSRRVAPQEAIERFTKSFHWADTRVWANGASFDFPILKQLFNTFGYEVPWSFYNEMDMRTLKNLVTKEEFERLRVKPTVAHDAFEDAFAQARSTVNLMGHLGVAA